MGFQRFVAHFVGVCALLAGSAALAAPVVVDLSSWSRRGPATSGTWVVAPGGGSVTQTINGDPSFFVSNTSVIDTTLRARVRVDDNDNDLIGFVFGFNGPVANGTDMNFLLFDWRRGNQTSAAGDVGRAGFTLDRVQGNISNYGPGFWGHTSGPGFDVLATRYATNLGWVRGTDYDFTIRYTSSNIRIDVAGGAFGTAGQTIFNYAGSFVPGSVGFYDYSQPNVRFSAVTLEANAVPEPGSIALLGVAMLGLVATRRRGG